PTRCSRCCWDCCRCSARTTSREAQRLTEPSRGTPAPRRGHSCMPEAEGDDMQHPDTRPARWPWLLVAVAVAAGGWWLLRPAPEPAADMAQMPSATDDDAIPPPPVLPGEAEAPGIQHPVEPPAEAADAAIPALADSDAGVLQELEALAGDPSLLGVLVREHVVQRLVVMVDNLTEPRVTAQVLALRQLPGNYAVVEGEGATVADTAASSARYAPYVAAFTGADAGRVASVYRRFYPLFQEAYVELGY